MTVSNERVSFRSWFRPGCIALAILFLAGCGGGGGSGSGIAESDGSDRGAAGHLPISYEPIGNYGTSSLPRPDARDAKHMPVYADGYGNGQGLFVGIHQKLDVSSLSVAGRRGETVMRHGRLDGGAGRTAVAEYLSEVYGPDNYIYGVDDRAERYASPPVVRVIGDATPHETDMVIRAIQLVNTDLAQNGGLAGTVSWSGVLLGFTPSRAAVAGDAEISVVMSSLRGRAECTNLESWGPNAAPGVAGTGTVWLDGNLGYSIAVKGNTFREMGGDGGRLTGIFVGRDHEGVAGTLERGDLTAAFGASR